MPSALLKEIEQTRVARFSELKPFSLAFLDSFLPEGRKKNLKVIGRGVVENPDMQPPITDDHGFTVSYILIPPGGGAGLHAHKTFEVFIPLNGRLTMFIGDDKERLVLEPFDVVSIPIGLMRGFRNLEDIELMVMVMLSGSNGGGSVIWHEDVLHRAATESGLSIDEQGNLKRLSNFRMPDQIDGNVV